MCRQFSFSLGVSGHFLLNFYYRHEFTVDPNILRVLNRLNARQSKLFTEFPMKDSFKPFLAIDVCLELSSD